MLVRILTRLIGSEWRAFCGVSRDDFVSLTTTILECEGYEYQTDEFEPTSGERVIFGSDEDGDRIEVLAPVDFEIDVISATADPLTRFGIGFVLDEDQRRAAMAELCIVTIRGLDADTRPYVANVVRQVVDESDRPPWYLVHHVSFRLAVLLRLKVRLLWKYWLDVYELTQNDRSAWN